jgi:hypothetical protein
VSTPWGRPIRPRHWANRQLTQVADRRARIARWARLHATGNRQRLSNWRNRRTIERGRRPRITQAADAARSSLPVYRDRINRATGRPHRDDAQLGRTSDRSLARMAQQRQILRAANDGPARTSLARQFADAGVTVTRERGNDEPPRARRSR